MFNILSRDTLKCLIIVLGSLKTVQGKNSNERGFLIDYEIGYISIIFN